MLRRLLRESVTVASNEHNTYSDQSDMNTTEAADLASDLARVAGGDA
jgi:hypothetical protein